MNNLLLNLWEYFAFMLLLTLLTYLQFLCPHRSLLLKLEAVILKLKEHQPAVRDWVHN